MRQDCTVLDSSYADDLAATLKKQSVTPGAVQLSDPLAPADLSEAAAQM